MKIQLFFNSKLKIDLDGTSSKNPLRNGLVRPLHKFAKLITKTNSKMQELKTNDKIINNSIYENR